MTNKLTARIAGFATLALAALPLAALTTAAHAQDARPAYDHEVIHIGDLDLTSDAGQTVLAKRVGVAARHFCKSERGLDLKAACEASIRAEAYAKLAAKTQLASRI